MSKVSPLHVRQNESELQQKLAAAFYCDWRIKLLYTLQVIITVIIPLVFATVAVLYPQFRVSATLYGLVVSILDVAFIEKRQNIWKSKNAKYLSLFDCDLLKVCWPDFGKPPLDSDAEELGQKFFKRGRGLHRLEYWYTEEIGKLPLPVATLVCQHINIWWPKKIREYYVNALSSIAIGLSIIIVFMTIFVIHPVGLNIGLEGFTLSILVPIYPVLFWLVREWRKQSDCLEKLSVLSNYWLDTWEKLIDDDISEQELSHSIEVVQRALHDHICSHPPMFRWIHNLYDKSFSALVKREVTRFVEQYGSKHGSVV